MQILLCNFYKAKKWVNDFPLIFLLVFEISCFLFEIWFQIKLVNINSADLVDGRPPVVLGLIWTIILYFQVIFFSNYILYYQTSFEIQFLKLKILQLKFVGLRFSVYKLKNYINKNLILQYPLISF